MSKPRAGAKSRTTRSESRQADDLRVDRFGGDLPRAAAIFVVALTVRLVYLYQIESMPLFYQLASDSRSYDEWAQELVAGRWLGREVFYQAPLYPYFLGALQFMLGRDLWLIRALQMVLGSLSCVLLYFAGKTLFSRPAGVTAAALVALYAPAIFFDGLIQKSALDLFLVSVLLFFSTKLSDGGEKRHWVALGCLIGLLALSRENALVWLLALPVWAWFYFKSRPAVARLFWIGLIFAGAAAVLVPVGLHNLIVGGEFTLTTSQLGPNFFIGNNPAATGNYAPLRGGRGDPRFERRDATEIAEMALKRKLSPGEVSSYWLDRSLAYIRSQPFEWLALLTKKWLMVWNMRETEDADDIYIYAQWSSLLDALGLFSHFGLLAPLAAVGGLLSRRHGRRLALLYLLLLTFAASVALFYVFARYRYPMTPFLALLAGFALSEGVRIIRERRWSLVAVASGIFVLTALVVRLPVSGELRQSAAGWNNVGNALAKQGKREEASQAYRRALEVDPRDPVSHYNLGNLLMEQEQWAAAARRYAEAINIQPDFVDAHNNFGNLLSRQGDLARALEHFQRALQLSPGRADIRVNRALALARSGRLDEAVVEFRNAIEIESDLAEAYYHLGLVLAARGDLAGSVDLFRQALDRKPDYAAAKEAMDRARTELAGRRPSRR
jgi:tetratricopeptide (TPR) repeat protein